MEDLSILNLGDSDNPKFKSKAAECKTIIPFVVGLCQSHVVRLGEEGPALHAAGAALLRFCDQLKAAHEVPTTADCQALKTQRMQQVMGNIETKHVHVFKDYNML